MARPEIRFSSREPLVTRQRVLAALTGVALATLSAVAIHDTIATSPDCIRTHGKRNPGVCVPASEKIIRSIRELLDTHVVPPVGSLLPIGRDRVIL